MRRSTKVALSITIAVGAPVAAIAACIPGDTGCLNGSVMVQGECVIPSGDAPANTGVDSATDAEDSGPDEGVDSSGGSCGQAMCSGTAVNEQTDPNNCGRCGHSCQGGACSACSCQPVTLTTQVGSSSNGIAVDSTSVYYNATSGTNCPSDCTNYIFKVPMQAGGLVTTLATVASSMGFGLAVNGQNVYWASQETGGGAILSVPTDGGTVSTLATTNGSPWPLTIDTANVYWANGGDAGEQIMQVPLDGGVALTLTSGAVSPSGIAVDSTNVYWTGWSNGVPVQRVAIGGGSANQLAPSTYSGEIAVANGNAYWTQNVSSGPVESVPTIGGTPATIAMNQNYPFGLVVDANYAYFTLYGSGGSVVGFPLDGGAGFFIAQNQNWSKWMAISSAAIFWTTQNAVMMAAKP